MNEFTKIAPIVMSKCNVSYDNSDMIYTVTFQSKDHKTAVIKMDSSCVHDFLAAVTMGF